MWLEFAGLENDGQHRGVETGNSSTEQWQTGIWWTGKWRTGKWRIGKWLAVMEMMRWTISDVCEIHRVSKSSFTLFTWPILTLFGSTYCSWKICKKMAVFFSNNVQLVYEYYTMKKQEIFCVLSMLPLRLPCVSFLQLLQKCVQSLTFIQTFRNKFISLHSL